MPLVDLPQDQLFEYQGRNPRPADFEAFWDDALRELEASNPRAELVPHPISAPFAECFDLFFDGVDGARQHAKFARPSESETPVPCVLEFHGYSGNSGDWSGKLPFVARGQAVASLDCRGQGGLSEDRSQVKGNTLNGHIIRGLQDALEGHPEKLYYRQMFLDTAQLARVVSQMNEIDGNRLGARGGSQGGALTLACSALAPIKKAAPEFPFLCDYKRVWEMDLATGAYAELKSWFRNHDPRHERAEAVWNALGYIDIQHLAPRIRAEVLMAVGLGDTICPPSTQFAAFNRIESRKEAVFYPDFGHEGLLGFGDVAYEFFGDL